MTNATEVDDHKRYNLGDTWVYIRLTGDRRTEHFLGVCVHRHPGLGIKEAKTVIEAWRWHYNSIRPRSTLGYRPTAPVATVWPPDQQFTNLVAQMTALN